MRVGPSFAIRDVAVPRAVDNEQRAPLCACEADVIVSSHLLAAGATFAVTIARHGYRGRVLCTDVHSNGRTWRAVEVLAQDGTKKALLRRGDDGSWCAVAPRLVSSVRARDVEAFVVRMRYEQIAWPNGPRTRQVAHSSNGIALYTHLAMFECAQPGCKYTRSVRATVVAHMSSAHSASGGNKVDRRSYDIAVSAGDRTTAFAMHAARR